MGSPPPSHPAARLPASRLAGVGLVVFAANAALLVLQLVAGKLLAPFVGSSLETWTAVIGVFLTGIALGNGYGGRLADRYPTPRALALLLAGGAVAALWMVAFPRLLDATGWHRALPLGPRIPVLAFALCLPAGLVLSLLTPLAIKLALPDVRHAGRVAGMVFALGTLGCLLGNYLTGFYLIPAFTIDGIVYAAAATLGVLAAGTALIAECGFRNAESERNSEPEAPGVSIPNSEIRIPQSPDLRRWCVVVFLASFAGMTLELTASRLLAQVLGVSLYTWTGIFGVMLAGTAAGNFLGGVVADRAGRRPRGPDGTPVGRGPLAGSLLLAAAAATATLLTFSAFTRFGAFYDYGLVGQILGWTFALFFAPMLLLGTVSPQVIRLAVPDVAHAGRVAGRIYGWSTAGAIAGTFAAGYVLLSTAGTFRTLLGVALVLVAASFLVLPRIWENNTLLYLFSVTLGLVGGGLILTARGNMRANPDGSGGVIAVRDTNYYTIMISHDPDHPGALRLNLDHLIHSSVDPRRPTYLHYEHEWVQIELLREARTRTPAPRVLVVGGGGYTFPRCARILMPETSVDVVEIDPGVTQAAYDFLGLDPALGIRPHHMDGRQYVAERAGPGTFDLVMTDAVNDFSVPSHLLTVEYNDAVKRTLAPGGAYLLTVIDSIGEGKLWKAAVHTLRKSFPHVELLASTAGWTPGDRQVYVIYASDRPFDPAAVARAADAAWAAARDPVAAPLAAALGGPALGGNPTTYTHLMAADDLAPYLNADPPVILTDQYAPVDNLMANLFRLSRKKEPAK